MDAGATRSEAPIDHRSDAEVIAASLSAPREFAVLFDRHFARIHGYLRRRAGATADDLASDVFVVAFERRMVFDRRRGDALPWLYGIASNVAAADFRRRRRDGALTDRIAAGRTHAVAWRDDPQVWLDAGRPDQADALSALVDRLSEDDLTTLVLYAWEDLSYEQIADALAVPIGTVRSRLHRIRRMGRELHEAVGASTTEPPTDPRSRHGR